LRDAVGRERDIEKSFGAQPVDASLHRLEQALPQFTSGLLSGGDPGPV
jgi:hypothetical protein